MRVFAEKTQILGLLAMILLTGFLMVALTGYVVSRNSLHEGVAGQTLPLTGDNIYSEIQKDLLRPAFIASRMAEDVFLRDWMLQGEKDLQKIVGYLGEIKDKFGLDTAFVVSERTRNYYHPGGLLRQLEGDVPRDDWFFRVRSMAEPYETHVDVDMVKRGAMTIYINFRVMDLNNNFIAVAGVGLSMDSISRIVESYQTRFQRRIYFVDPRGGVVLAGLAQAMTSGSIYQTPGLGEVAENLLAFRNEPQNFSYENEHGMVLVNSRFIDELGWFLVVEQDDSQGLQLIQQVLTVNLVIGGTVTLLMLLLAWLVIQSYQKRLERMAAIDSLTGLYNRQTFDLLFDRALLESRRSGQPLSALLIDLNFFQQLNETHGHRLVDAVIKQLAARLCELVRDSDVTARWGGGAFVVLLRNCSLERTRMIAETIRQALSQEDFSQLEVTTLPTLTVSLGGAQYDWHDTPAGFFARIAAALSAAQSQGHDQVVIAERTLS